MNEWEPSSTVSAPALRAERIRDAEGGPERASPV